MTNQLSLRTIDLPLIRRFGVGFDDMFDNFINLTANQVQQNYPPYNMIRRSDDEFVIEIAVAGFKPGEINLEVEGNQLKVHGDQTKDDAQVEFMHRGISARSFVRQWTLAEHVEVVNAEQENGILSIELKRRVPEEKKPKSIAITYKG